MIDSYTVFNFSTLATAVLSLFLGVFVFLNNRRSKLNILWGLVSLETAVWSYGLYKVISANSESEAIWWNKILYLGAIFIPVLYFHFIAVLIGLSQKNKFKILFFYLISFSFLFLNFTSKNFIKGAPPVVGFKHWMSGGYFYYPFVAFFVLVVSFSFLLALVNLKNLSSFKKYQLKLVLFAGFIGFIGGATTFLPQLFGFYPFGNFFVCFYVIFIAYAITRYRLMGIKVVLGNTIFFVILLFFILGANYLTIFIHNRISHFFGENSYLYFIINFSVAFLTVIIFLPFYRYAKNFSEVLVYHHRNPRKLAQAAVLKLSQIINFEELAYETAILFRQTLDIEQVAVFRYNIASRKITKLINHESFNEFLKNSQTDFWGDIIKQGKMIIKDEICQSNFRVELNQVCDSDISIILPIKGNANLNLVFLLGQKINGGFYAKEDFEFIEKIEPYLARSLYNASKFKKISDRNTELEESQEQFISLAVQNLLLPAAQIEGIAGLGIKEPETAVNRLHSCQNYAKRIGETVDNLLLASRLKDDKIAFETRPTNLNKVLAEAIAKKEDQAKEKNLEFKVKILTNQDVYIESERTLIEQLLLNLIDNAINYTSIGSIIIKLEKIDKYATIKIIDTGIGIDPKDRKKLFHKFFKGGNNYNREGLGFGLYVAKKIIDFHPGAEIKIEDVSGTRGIMVSLKFLIVEKPNFD
jgi:signal transduction histidine kinase